MARPTFLVVEPEPEDALSTRKLVLETAKFNVLTAYSSGEGVQTLQEFPKINALIAVATMDDCELLVSSARTTHPKLPIVLLAPNPTHTCEGDHRISTHDPEALVALMRELFGDPRKGENKKPIGRERKRA